MDIEEPWSQDIGQNSQDLIHMRMLAGSIFNWGRLYSQILRYIIAVAVFLMWQSS